MKYNPSTISSTCLIAAFFSVFCWSFPILKLKNDFHWSGLNPSVGRLLKSSIIRWLIWWLILFLNQTFDSPVRDLFNPKKIAIGTEKHWKFSWWKCIILAKHKIQGQKMMHVEYSNFLSRQIFRIIIRPIISQGHLFEIVMNHDLKRNWNWS